MEKTRKGLCLALLLSAFFMLLCGCGNKEGAKVESPKQLSPEMEEKPAIPKNLQTNQAGVPLLNVYQTDAEEIVRMDMEAYLLGVVAGEMKNDWPMEALKAQAILARTFVLKFCEEKKSKYAGADISTDIQEAQAYDDTNVNDRVEKAVSETRGLVLSYHGELPYAWFHAHSGGLTERAREGLAWEGDEPGYTKVAQGRDSAQAPKEAREWQAAFSREEFLSAAKKAGYAGDENLTSIKIGKTAESGRAVTLSINGQMISAPEIRLALGSTKMRSTLLTELSFRDGRVSMAGKGYGHGVGMPQWGAFGMAEEGKTAKEIVTYYFDDVTVQRLWD